MFLFKKANNNKLEEIKGKHFKREKDLQKVCEKNLEQIFGLDFVKSEFALHNLRPDTVAFNPRSKSFVIIEYKKDKSSTVIDQGYAYLALMLNNKADFILEYNENKNQNLKRTDVDWSQSKVIFVSSSFNIHQKQAINFKDLPIELWEIKQFANDTLCFLPVEAADSKESIKTISKKSKEIEKVNKEIKVYTEDDHLKQSREDIKELYETFKQAILRFSEMSINPTKLYIGFVADKRTICDIRPQKNALKLWINLKKGELKDSKKIMRDVSNTGHWGNGDYELRITGDEDLEYILSLIRYAYVHHTL